MHDFHLAGLKDPEHAAVGPLGGAILETTVFSEILKTLFHPWNGTADSRTLAAAPQPEADCLGLRQKRLVR